MTHLWNLDDELLNRFPKDAAHWCIERLAATVNFPADPTFAGGDKEVLIMETIAKVLRNHRVHKKGIRQISRERNLSRNTVRKVLRGECESHQYVRSEQPRPKLGEYCERLEAMLEDNAARSRRDQ